MFNYGVVIGLTVLQSAVSLQAGFWLGHSADNVLQRLSFIFTHTTTLT